MISHCQWECVCRNARKIVNCAWKMARGIDYPHPRKLPFSCKRCSPEASFTTLEKQRHRSFGSLQCSERSACRIIPQRNPTRKSWPLNDSPPLRYRTNCTAYRAVCMHIVNHKCGKTKKKINAKLWYNKIRIIYDNKLKLI